MPAESEWYRLVREGGGHYRSPGYFDGVPRLVAVRPLKDYPLVVNVAVTEASALANWKYRAMLIGLGAMLTLHLFAAPDLRSQQQIRTTCRLQSRALRTRGAARRETHTNWSKPIFVSTAPLAAWGKGLPCSTQSCELVVCNKRYLELYSFPPNVVKPGTTFRQILEYRTKDKTFFDDIDERIESLVEKMRSRSGTGARHGSRRRSHFQRHQSADRRWRLGLDPRRHHRARARASGNCSARGTCCGRLSRTFPKC